MKKLYLIAIASILAVVVVVLVGLSITKGSRQKELSCLPEKAEGYYKQALTLISEGKTDQAIYQMQKVIAENPKSIKTAGAFLGLGDAYLAKAMLVEAREAFLKVINDYSNSPYIKEAQQRLGRVNISILFSPIMTEDSTTYTVKQGDTLTQIADKFKTTVDLIAKNNAVNSSTLRPGMQLKICKSKFSILVDKSQNTLSLKSGEKVVKVYQVSTGKDTSITPSGIFKIVNRIMNPTWYAPGGKVIPPGDPQNILGSRWLGIDKSGYGIHGTTEPSTIGRSVTAGCVRMLNNDVEELFVIIPVGTEVTILD